MGLDLAVELQGAVQGLLLMTIANVVTSLTTLSMAAVCTNGQIKATTH